MMTGRTDVARVLLAAALAALAAPACGYDPSPPSGTLLCAADRSCPDGYTCVSGSTATCWRPSDLGAAQRLIGHWVFGGASRRVIVCSNGVTEDKAWVGDYFDVEEGGSAALRTFYYCDMDLDVGASGATILQPGGSCSAMDTLDPTLVYTWTPETFTLSSSDGSTGSITASIPYTGTSPLESFTCTMDFTGTVTKT